MERREKPTGADGTLQKKSCDIFHSFHRAIPTIHCQHLSFNLRSFLAQQWPSTRALATHCRRRAKVPTVRMMTFRFLRTPERANNQLAEKHHYVTDKTLFKLSGPSPLSPWAPKNCVSGKRLLRDTRMGPLWDRPRDRFGPTIHQQLSPT